MWGAKPEPELSSDGCGGCSSVPNGGGSVLGTTPGRLTFSTPGGGGLTGLARLGGVGAGLSGLGG